ncbi:MAG: cohesin domain-containing protein [Chloroflexota bacterium]|nr:cohesin domain-containing protein [Chloroflexota bacterium]
MSLGRRWGVLLGLIVLSLGLVGLAAPPPRTIQLWPDHTVGVTSSLLEGMLAHADQQVLPFGVQRTSADDVVRARTYLHFPLDVFPPGAQVVRATLHAYVDGVSNAGEAAFGAYRVLEPWEEQGWTGEPATWPVLLTVPIAATVASFDVVTPALRVSTPTTTPVITPTDTSALFSRPAGHGLIQSTMVVIAPSSVNVTQGSMTTVDIRVEDVTDLYSVEVYMTFDRAVLEVVDADPDAPDVQIQPGDFLNPDFVDENIVYQDDEGVDGEVYFAIYQEDPAAPVSGSGVLATITFQGKAVGTSAIDLADVFLGDYDDGTIAAGLQDGSVTVIGQGAPTPTTGPTPTSTSTSTPGPSPTPTPTSSTSSLPTPPPGSDLTPTSPTSPLPTPTSPPPASPSPTSQSPAVPSPTVPGSVLQRGAGTWLTWDVTVLMRAWQAGEVPNHGLALAPAPDPDADPDTTGDLLVARWLPADDPGTRPYLVVEFEVHPVTPTPVPILPPAGGPVRWWGAGLLFVGVAILALGLALRRR